MSGSPARAQQDDRTLLVSRDGLTVRWHLQAGLNAVAESNLYWNFADTVAPGAGFDSDAQWLEAYIKPGIGFELAGEDATFYGLVSGVASYTWGTDAFASRNTGRATLEEAYLGFRVPVGPDATLDVSVGPRALRLGTGMLISNGASNGFERGALKFGPRKAWEMAAIARLTAGDVTGTLFYLDPNEFPNSDNGNEIAGLDLRRDWAEGGYLGLTYIDVLKSRAPYPQAAPGGIGAPTVIAGAREGLQVLNLYARTNPLGNAFLAGDLAWQRNDRIALRAWGGRVQAGYTFAAMPWRPTLTYGYQTLSGDDPDTAGLERFDPLFYDGSPAAWAAGSKSAMVFINSNVQTHSLSLKLQPTPRDTVTLRYAHIRVNELMSPIQFGQATRVVFAGGVPTVIAGVTDPHLSDDVFIEWSRIINRNTFLTAGFSVSVPGDGITGVVAGNVPNWTGGFVNVVINF